MQIFEFTGTAREAGIAYGKAILPYASKGIALIAEKKRKVFERENVISQPALIKKYEAAITRWAPGWLDEFSGIAAVLDLPMEDFLLLHAPSPFPESCTSWIVMPDVSEHDAIIIHKNRDANLMNCQSFVVKHIESTLRWWGALTIPLTGALSAMNEAGLAMVMNNGEPCTENNPVGLGTTDIVRLVMERARNASEALALLEEIIRGGYYAHGRSGSIFFVVDPRHAFIVESTARRCFREEITHGYAVRSNYWRIPAIIPYKSSPGIPEHCALRYDRACALLAETLQKKKIGIMDCQAIAKDRLNGQSRAQQDKRYMSLTSGNTSMAFTACPAIDHPAVFSKIAVALGPPSTTCAIPMATGANGSPDILVNSALSEKAYQLREKYWLDSAAKLGITAMENKLWRQFQQHDLNARNACRNQSGSCCQVARNIYSDSLSALTSRALHFLNCRHC